MKEKTVDLRQQIVKALAGEEQCSICGYRGKLSTGLVGNRIVSICFYCHREELRKEKKLRKCKGVQNGRKKGI